MLRAFSTRAAVFPVCYRPLKKTFSRDQFAGGIYRLSDHISVVIPSDKRDFGARACLPALHLLHTLQSSVYESIHISVFHCVLNRIGIDCQDVLASR